MYVHTYFDHLNIIKHNIIIKANNYIHLIK